ncbi:MAG: radical SAM protein [Lachnospiraceae bacterium]|nr:radical SAM protein [Lachnospiraceae bacterium]
MANIDQLEKEIKTPLPGAPAREEASTYYVEILSECNLKCVMCGFGSREIFERKRGKMDVALFGKIVDEIAKRSPHATVAPYHHCEPLLHPQLSEMVKIIKSHNLFCEVSTNLNVAGGLKELLEAGVDSLDISVSGFYQETYEKNHVGGDIEEVKRNLKLLHDLIKQMKTGPQITVFYHMYTDNLGEDFERMKEYVESLGFSFSPNWSRSICTEMSLKYIRETGYSRYHGETLKWFDDMPPLTDAYKSGIERMIYLPQDYLEGKWGETRLDECPMNGRLINIRWNGKLSLCSCTFDDRLSVYEYLTTPIEQLWEARRSHPVCRECLANNYALYMNYFDMDYIDKIARARLSPDLASNRRFFGDNGVAEL